jgi:N6-adenosine-specific RNA methylase IME4
MTRALVPQQLNFSLDGVPGRLTPTGMILDAGLDFAAWRTVGAQLARIHGAMLWWIGDWLLYGERAYGEKYAEALEATPYEYGTLRNAKVVAEAIALSRRRDNLTWAHHQEVAPLEPADQDRWLDWTSAIHPPHTVQDLRKAIRTWKRDEAATAAGPLPDGVFDVILADPPWEYDNTGVDGAAAAHYETMPIDTIMALRAELDLDAHTAHDATLFLWVTAPMLDAGLDVLDAWGFDYKACGLWIKARRGTGFYFGGGHELLFVATRGAHVPDYRGRELPSNVIDVPRGVHSAKPDEAYALIEYMYPDARRLELFARHPRPGWIPWGHLG